MDENLNEAIASRRREISTDAYSMSLGELTNLYRDGELDVHPEFQRVYRWTDEQKSKLIESILLGIPLPSIFVAQNTDGTWDVVDGVQRISTILQLQGLLVDEDRQPLPKLTLRPTRYLPQLDGKVWEDADPDKSLDQAQRLDIRRAKVDLKIIKRDSSPGAKYDLFQRLNGFGTLLSPQELRSCMVIATDRTFYRWIERLSKHESFVETTSLTDRLKDEQYDLELVLRYLAFRSIPEDDIRRIGALGDYLNDKSVKIAEDGIDYSVEEERFKTTFDLLSESLGDNSFRTFNPSKGRFQGSFSNTAFEIVGLGLAYHIDHYITNQETLDLENRVKKIWEDGSFGRGFATGKSPDERLRRTIPAGRSLFAP
ncbi:DUF262 domain-containing protein [Amycolatopsis sp. NPDC021455]|uniref:DUF262 domain-containing protein n=1 Tax=Amycolatopsis sp. NPDC021455 TaxID=3154901 RepID=UPI0033F5A37B